MGGKKKTLANRLAKMSDEERARYIQHRADIEEEARRRKEQLISTFMKTKIKREDGFSRLNLAKINQHWHQILRLSKCKQMREEVEHLKQFIDRVLEYKNRTINKLLEELEMAEEQYGHNFQSHFVHIDQTIVSQERYMDLMDAQYHQDLDQLLVTSTKEFSQLHADNREQHAHLKTVIFGLQFKFRAATKSQYERFLKKKEELTSTFRLQLGLLVKRREAHCVSIWRQIAEAVKSHVEQTDTRRLHLAELKRLDAESAAEIASNQERINTQEEEIRSLEQQFEVLKTKRAESIKNLTKTTRDETGRFFAKRKCLRKQLEIDDKQLVFLADKSNQSLKVLEKLKCKGEQIVSLMMTCRKLETPREQITKWMSFEPATEVEIDAEELEAIRSRGKLETEEESIDVVISKKQSSASSHSEEDKIIQREFALLNNLEKFWVVYNKAEIEHKELKREKKILLDQNKYFRGTLRGILEAIALDHSNPSKVSTRVASKKGVRSAPLRRIVV